MIGAGGGSVCMWIIGKSFTLTAAESSLTVLQADTSMQTLPTARLGAHPCRLVALPPSSSSTSGAFNV